MDQHALHAEGVGDEAGVLAARAAEAIERIAGDIVSADLRCQCGQCGLYIGG